MQSPKAITKYNTEKYRDDTLFLNCIPVDERHKPINTTKKYRASGADTARIADKVNQPRLVRSA